MRLWRGDDDIDHLLASKYSDKRERLEERLLLHSGGEAGGRGRTDEEDDGLLDVDPDGDGGLRRALGRVAASRRFGDRRAFLAEWLDGPVVGRDLPLPLEGFVAECLRAAGDVAARRVLGVSDSPPSPSSAADLDSRARRTFDAVFRETARFLRDRGATAWIRHSLVFPDARHPCCACRADGRAERRDAAARKVRLLKAEAVYRDVFREAAAARMGRLGRLLGLRDRGVALGAAEEVAYRSLLALATGGGELRREARRWALTADVGGAQADPVRALASVNRAVREAAAAYGDGPADHAALIPICLSRTLAVAERCAAITPGMFPTDYFSARDVADDLEAALAHHGSVRWMEVACAGTADPFAVPGGSPPRRRRRREERDDD